MIWALHGAFGSPRDWEELRQKGMNLRTVALWKMATGLRDTGAGLEEWGEAFLTRVRSEDPAPSLMGYSLGGRLALHALVADTRLWKSAIIVSAHPGLEEDEDRRARLESDARWANRLRTEEPLREILDDWKSQGVLAGTPRDFDRTHLEEHRGSLGTGFEEWSLGRQEPLRGQLTGVTCPVLWITGGEDEKFTRLAKRTVPGIAAARHVVVEGCGHRVPWEDPDTFARRVLRFQNEVAMA